MMVKEYCGGPMERLYLANCSADFSLSLCLQFSSLYRGNLEIKPFYTENELSAGGPPFAFFPHRYDGIKHTEKDPRLIVPEEADTFKVRRIMLATLSVPSVQTEMLLSPSGSGGQYPHPLALPTPSTCQLCRYDLVCLSFKLHSLSIIQIHVDHLIPTAKPSN
jgi:hypothetical protein